MQMPITAEDVIVGIFYYMKQNHIPKLSADREILHRAFFHISAKYPKMKPLFSFRQRELFPESTQLDQALSNLDATGLISRQNLTPKYYCFEEPLENSYKNFSVKILKEAGIDEASINNMADDIKIMVQDA